MALRFAVQADDEAECARGLELLLSLGLQPALLPCLLTGNRWMARAVPVPTTRLLTKDEQAPSDQ